MSATDIAMLAEPTEDLGIMVRISPEITCLNPDCVVCGDAVVAQTPATVAPDEGAP